MKPYAWVMKRDDYHSITRNEKTSMLQKARTDQDWTVTPLYAIPEGCVVVPVEPTGKMIDAWHDQLSKNGFRVEGSDLTPADAVMTYKAMLKAAQEEV